MVRNSTILEEDVNSSQNFGNEEEYRNSSGAPTSRIEESCMNTKSTEKTGDEDVEGGRDESDPTDCANNIDRIRALTFKGVKEAEEFYISYGREVGFDVRKNTLKRKREPDLVMNREWLCTREGLCAHKLTEIDRKREAKAETRYGCKASFRVALDLSTGKYKVMRFQRQNNHPLENFDISHRLRCNRFLTPSTKTMLNVMTNVGFRPGHVLYFIKELGGGSASGILNRKDRYNYLNSQRLKMIEGGDVNTLLGLLEGMKIKDESLIFKYTVDGNGTLTRLFWCHGMSRAEYELFGDIVLFDSTHKTNMYWFPLVMFSGVNCHLVTCIFGVAILYNETIESYRWLLEIFQKIMNGKAPIDVLNDQDASMCTVFEREFLGAIHGYVAGIFLVMMNQMLRFEIFQQSSPS